MENLLVEIADDNGVYQDLFVEAADVIVTDYMVDPARSILPRRQPAAEGSAREMAEALHQMRTEAD